MNDLFVVVVPTWNRAHTLAAALDSVLAQTDQDWMCLVLDDGSTDGTDDLIRQYIRRDYRFIGFLSEANQGGVAMNEAGMAKACELGEFWSRLGSDDFWLPDKLALDRIALASHGACFGPYRHAPALPGQAWVGELNEPQDARAALLRGEFAASWANIAARTSVLRDVKAAYGCFVDRRLRNMEDWLFNTRMARLSDVVWRGGELGGRRVCIGATHDADVPFAWAHDAAYTVAVDSASYGETAAKWAGADSAMTDVLRGEDRQRGVEVRDFVTSVKIATR